MGKVVFLINPLSSKRLPASFSKFVHDIFSDDHVEISASESASHLTALAEGAVKSEADIIAAVGGDGTVHLVAQSLVGTKCSLAIIPAGSGNGLARHCGISMNPLRALEQIRSGIVRPIDVIQVDDAYSVNVAGVGFDGHIARVIAGAGRRGFTPYLWKTFREYFTYRSQDYHVCIDGKEKTKRAFLISVCNSSQYGNNAVIAPAAEIDDGFFDVVYLEPFSLWEVPRVVYALFRGKINRLSVCHTQRSGEVLISGDRMEVHLDGESYGTKNRLHCRLKPRALNLILPQ